MIRDPWIFGPQGCGLMLALMQLGLKLCFRSVGYAGGEFYEEHRKREAASAAAAGKPAAAERAPKERTYRPPARMRCTCTSMAVMSKARELAGDDGAAVEL